MWIMLGTERTPGPLRRLEGLNFHKKGSGHCLLNARFLVLIQMCWSFGYADSDHLSIETTISSVIFFDLGFDQGSSLLVVILKPKYYPPTFPCTDSFFLITFIEVVHYRTGSRRQYVDFAHYYALVCRTVPDIYLISTYLLDK